MVLLGVWIVYPPISTTVGAFFDRGGDTFVWFDNYKEIFTTDLLVTAIKNNALWVGVVPALVTAIGLIFAVLTERVALVGRVQDSGLHADGDLAARRGRDLAPHVHPGSEPGHGQRCDRGREGARRRAGAASRAPALDAEARRQPATRLVLQDGPSRSGGAARAHRDLRRRVPDGAEQAVRPKPLANGIAGVVWRDFKPGGGHARKVERRSSGSRRDGRAARRLRGRWHRRRRAPATARSPSRTLEAGTYRAAIGRRRSEALRRRLLARAEADHARGDDGLHLGLGRLRDGRDRRGPRRDPARRARGRPAPTAPASGRSSAASPCRCSRRCSASSSSRC